MGFSSDFLGATKQTWSSRQPYMSEEGAREVIVNMAGFVRVLMDWEQQERSTMRNQTGPTPRRPGGDDAA